MRCGGIGCRLESTFPLVSHFFRFASTGWEPFRRNFSQKNGEISKFADFSNFSFAKISFSPGFKRIHLFIFRNIQWPSSLRAPAAIKVSVFGMNLEDAKVPARNARPSSRSPCLRGKSRSTAAKRSVPEGPVRRDSSSLNRSNGARTFSSPKPPPSSRDVR